MVRIGDPVTLELGFQEMRNGLANGPGMDDKTGLWVVIEALRRVDSTKPCSAACMASRRSRKKSGCAEPKTSAFDIDPHVAIAVDVTHATDCPTIDKRQRVRFRWAKDR